LNSVRYSNYYAFMISQVPISQIDEESYKKDHRAISMPDSIKNYFFNTFYMFKYSGNGDNKPPKKEFKIR